MSETLIVACPACNTLNRAPREKLVAGGGKCGSCEFRGICGGSRARAYAVQGDPLAGDPACIYLPRAFRPTAARFPRP